VDHIRTLLPKVLRKRGLGDQVEASLIVFQAQQWIEKELTHVSAALSASQFKDGVLIIETQHSAASQECHLRKEDLEKYLKEECGHAALEGVRMKRAKV